MNKYLKVLRKYPFYLYPFLFINFFFGQLLFYLFRLKIKLLGIKYIIVELFNGKKMILDSNDRGLSHDLLFDPKKQREEFASNYIINHFKENPEEVFFDLGCNLGYYSILLSDYFDKIIGVEPVKSSAEICVLNSKINHFENKFTLIEGAIAPKSGFVKIDDKVAKNLVTVSSVFEKGSVGDCKSYTISEICNLQKIKKIDFLKMDIEGYEYEIIVEGQEEFFKFAPKMIFLEVHFGILDYNKSVELLTILKKNGYFVDKAYCEIKYKAKWMGFFSVSIQNFFQKILTLHNSGLVFENVDINEVLKDKNIMNAKSGAIEFIFKKM